MDNVSQNKDKLYPLLDHMRNFDPIEKNRASIYKEANEKSLDKYMSNF